MIRRQDSVRFGESRHEVVRIETDVEATQKRRGAPVPVLVQTISLPRKRDDALSMGSRPFAPCAPAVLRLSAQRRLNA